MRSSIYGYKFAAANISVSTQATIKYIRVWVFANWAI